MISLHLRRALNVYYIERIGIMLKACVRFFSKTLLLCTVLCLLGLYSVNANVINGGSIAGRDDERGREARDRAPARKARGRCDRSGVRGGLRR